MSPPPHYDRLRLHLEGTSQPLVELWGWRGTGKRAFLAELARREPQRAQVVVDAVRNDRRELDREMAAGRRRGVRFVLVEDEAGWSMQEILARLHPGQSLVVARRRHSGGGGDGPAPRADGPEAPAEVVPPESLLLERPEVVELWRRQRGVGPSPELLEWLLVETEGWMRPLELLAGEREPVTVGALATAAVERFLELEVLGSLGAEERVVLAAVAGGEGPPRHDRVVASLIEDWGLVRVEGVELRLPRLLRRYFERRRFEPRRPAATSAAEAGPAEVRPGAPRDVVELRLLGPPQLHRRLGAAGTVVPLEWSLRRALLVLAFLASRPERRATRGELVEAVWPDADAEGIRKNFHPTISLLRRSLAGPERDAPPAVELAAGAYRLSPGLDWEVDVERFRSLVERGRGSADDEERAAAWSAACRLYRGTYLPGHDLNWVTAHRDELQRLYLETKRELGAVLMRLERPREAEEALRTVLVEDPLQEEVHVAIMRIYAERGRRDLVRRQYERLCQVLLQELGLEPLPTTAAEYQRLMA